jgi:hypothetical protein
MLITKTAVLAKQRKETRELDDAWATMIKSRDGWRCVICGSDYKPNAHHIVPREHKRYKYEPDNGITLCVKHHKFSRVISAHNNPLAFLLWLRRFKPLFFDVACKRTEVILKSEFIQLGV